MIPKHQERAYEISRRYEEEPVLEYKCGKQQRREARAAKRRKAKGKS